MNIAVIHISALLFLYSLLVIKYIIDEENEEKTNKNEKNILVKKKKENRN